MKRFILILAALPLAVLNLTAQPNKGTVIYSELASDILKGNPAGENPNRLVSIYLPAGYGNSSQRYPVIYFLHGSSSYLGEPEKINEAMSGLLDRAIDANIMRPIIMVMVDNVTRYGGSFYVNSSINGRWADFMVEEVVQFIDNNYRTIANRNSRGISGHSMGGYGAMRLAMENPGIYGSVYATSPALIWWNQNISDPNREFRFLASLGSEEELRNNWTANLRIMMGRAMAPNLDNPPFYCDLPLNYVDNEPVIDYIATKTLRENTLIELIDKNVENLKKLNGIKYDWGRFDVPGIKESAPTMSLKLLSFGIDHEAEEFNGHHGNRLFSEDGRFLYDLLPFFNRVLEFK